MSNCHATTALCDQCGGEHDIANSNYTSLMVRLERAERERDIYKRIVQIMSEMHTHKRPSAFKLSLVKMAQAAIREAKEAK